MVTNMDADKCLPLEYVDQSITVFVVGQIDMVECVSCECVCVAYGSDTEDKGLKKLNGKPLTFRLIL